MLRASNREAVLIDFGLARQLSFEESASITGGATPAFAPPEQLAQICDPAQQGKRVRLNPALDVYSLAATLYVLVAKQEPPFIPMNNPMMTAWHMQMMKMSFTAPNQLNPSLSQRVSEGILQGMALDVSQRPQNMTAWLELLGLGQEQEIVAPRIPPTVPDQYRTTVIKTPPVPQPRRVGIAHNQRITVQTPDIRHQTSLPQSFVEDLGSGIKLEMVLIPAGSFMMGTPDDEIARLCKEYGTDWFKRESPQHRVEIKEPFYMGKFLVTQGQWQAVMGSNPSHFKNGNNYPVESVSWNDCQEFIKKINKATRKTYRLPSEAEWEYACRAGTTTAFYFGETITTDQANYDGNYVYGKGKKGVYRQKTTAVDSFPANAFGLHDMHGNLWEWCADEWHESYKDKPEEVKDNGSVIWSSSDASLRVLRGGSWYFNPRFCRSAYRYGDFAVGSNGYWGFRVVCVGSTASP